MSSAANGIQRGDQRSMSDRARVTLRADIPAGTGRLPGRIRACLFDMDGVLMETATLHAVGVAGLGTAVVSSSANCREVLEAAGIADLFDVRVDGGTVGVDRAGQAVALRRLGADVVIADLAELLASS